MFATTCTSSEAIFRCIRKTHKLERLQNCAACSSGLLCLLIGFYTRSPTYVATVNFRVAEKKTLQLSFFEWSLCYRLLTGDMETALHFAADVQGGLLQGAEEESLPASDGFMVADANQLVTLEQQKRDAVDVLHSHVRGYVQKRDLKLLLIACLQWGQACNDYQPDLQTKQQIKVGTPACKNCAGLNCSLSPSAVAHSLCESDRHQQVLMWSWKSASCRYTICLVCWLGMLAELQMVRCVTTLNSGCNITIGHKLTGQSAQIQFVQKIFSLICILQVQRCSLSCVQFYLTDWQIGRGAERAPGLTNVKAIHWRRSSMRCIPILLLS